VTGYLKTLISLLFILALASCSRQTEPVLTPKVITDEPEKTAAETEEVVEKFTIGTFTAIEVPIEETSVESVIITAPKAEFEGLSPSNKLAITTHGINEEDEKYSVILDDLNAFFAEYGENAGFLYYNIDTGASFEYNADERLAAASIIKAPYSRAVLGAESDLTRTFEMTEELLNSPSELIGGKPVGSLFTIEELIKAAIVRSDNTAFKMLYHYLGYSDFNEYSQSLNIPHRMTDENYWFRLSARQTSVYFKEMYYFSKQHINGGFLHECLTNTQYNLFRQELSEYTVAGKYGYLLQDEYYTLGCASIVYAESPYIIVGYVRGYAEEPLDENFFRKAAGLTNSLHIAL